MANKEKKDEVPKKQTEEEIIASYKMVKGDYRLKVRVYEANDLIPAKYSKLFYFFFIFFNLLFLNLKCSRIRKNQYFFKKSRCCRSISEN